MASEQAVQVGTDLVSFTFAEGVALSTSCLEEIGTLLCVSYIAKSVSKKISLVRLKRETGSGRNLAATTKFGEGDAGLWG